MSQDEGAPLGTVGASLAHRPFLIANVCAVGCGRNNPDVSWLPLTQRLRRLGIADL